MGGSAPALSCIGHDFSPAYDRLGVQIVDDAILVRYLACDGEVVKSVRLYELDGDNVAPDEGDLVLWEAVGVESVVLASGLVPTRSGGEAIELLQEEDYLIEVETDRNTVDTFAFGVADLSTSDFYVNLRKLNDAEFTETADRSCSKS